MKLLRFLSLAALVLGLVSTPGALGAPVRVLVWDEQQPAQKQVYPNFLGNEIAGYLSKQKGLKVSSARLDDPSQGLSHDALDHTDVLVWWGHVRQGEISSETARDIVARVRSGKLGLISLHSAHWSAPFVEAMNSRARENAMAQLEPSERATAVVTESSLYPNFRTPPKVTDRLTPSVLLRKPSDGSPVKVALTLPNCCFPAFRGDGKPSRLHVVDSKHPIARGIPSSFVIDQTEMYDEPFHVPAPDAVVLEERWQGGEWFRSGMVWNLGKGKVFYFRPGHETYPVFKNPVVLQVIENAVRWAAPK